MEGEGRSQEAYHRGADEGMPSRLGLFGYAGTISRSHTMIGLKGML